VRKALVLEQPTQLPQQQLALQVDQPAALQGLLRLRS
jgi:hypothetical protein